jgi:hypothetical protein
MNIDILPINHTIINYRGIDRLLSAEQFNVTKGFKQLLEMYFDYISTISEYADVEDIFCKIHPFYSCLIENGVLCDMIIANKEPINNFCNKELQLLGLDIVNEFDESLLPLIADSYNELSKYKSLLNENILCKNIDDCVKITTNSKDFILSEYGREMEIKYIYKVIC